MQLNNAHRLKKNNKWTTKKTTGISCYCVIHLSPYYYDDDYNSKMA